VACGPENACLFLLDGHSLIFSLEKIALYSFRTRTNRADVGKVKAGPIIGDGFVAVLVDCGIRPRSPFARRALTDASGRC
jgi:hypothetical protein